MKKNDLLKKFLKYFLIELARLLIIVLLVIGMLSTIENKNSIIDSKDDDSNIKVAEYTGELIQGVEYTDGQYTYRYMQQYTENGDWENIDDDGWGVCITDRESTDDITTQLCTEISGKPIVSMHSMFSYVKATKIDVSSFDTSNVTNMSGMFQNSSVEEIIGLEKFDTSKVTTMGLMFCNTQLKNVNLNSFNTSNVTNFYGMFGSSKLLESLDVSSFDTSNATNFAYMFSDLYFDELDISNFDFSSNRGEELIDNMLCTFSRSTFKTIYVKDQETKTLLEGYNECSANYGDTSCDANFTVK